MRKLWTDEAWEDYIFWQENDRKTLKRVNNLIKEISRNGYGVQMGRPEMLVGDLSGWCSCEIDKKNRIVFRVSESEDFVEFSQCRTHYRDK